MRNAIETSDYIPNLSVSTLIPLEEIVPQKNVMFGEDCFFDVETEQLETARGIKTPIHAVVNCETGEMVGSYSKAGSVLRNRSLVDIFEEKLTEYGEKFEATYTCFDHGARFTALYKLPNVKINSVDSEGVLSLKLKNSYNGVWQVSLGRMVTRLICLNGMESTTTELALAKKHSSSLDLNRISFNIESVVTGAQNEMLAFSKMRGLELSETKEMNFLGNAAKYSKNRISKRLASRIAVEARIGDDTDPDRGDLWSLYNTGTRVLRDLSPIRPEVAQKAGKAWSDLCVIAANPNLSRYSRDAFSSMTEKPDAKWDLIAEVVA